MRAYEDLDPFTPDYELLVTSVAFEQDLERVSGRAEERFEYIWRSEVQRGRDCILKLKSTFMFGVFGERVDIDDVSLLLETG